MQVQIKKQLKIELDEADIIVAVGAFLLQSNIRVDPEDLAKINFVKSPQTGLRATLNVTEAETIEDEARCSPVISDLEVKVTNLSSTVQTIAGQVTSHAAAIATHAAKEHIAEVGLKVVESAVTGYGIINGELVTKTAEPEPVAVEEEAPGQVEPSTVEDVMPSVTEIAAMVEPTVEAEPVSAEEAPRKSSLFL